jgi:hypothetical protein
VQLEGRRRSQGTVDNRWVFLCPKPRRGRYARRTSIDPPHRKTVHEWHEAALHDALQGTGALGPVEGFGLEILETGAAEAGLARE